MIYPITIITVSLFWMSSCQSSKLTIFSRDAICHVTDRLDKRCSKEVPAAGSLKQCARLCGRDDSCIGASLDESGKCFLQLQCHENPICTEDDSNTRYVSRYCVNGTWDFSAQSCKCAYGFHGDRCEHYPRTCRDLITSGCTKGTYRVYIDLSQDGKKPVLPTCYIKPPSYIQFIVLKNRGQQAFNKSWDEYVEGFYIDGSHFWSGLDALHGLTHAGCTRLFLVFKTTQGWTITRVYYSFKVSGGSNKYKYTIGWGKNLVKGAPPNGTTFGECISPLKNTPFSTRDNDHDGDDQENCASRAGSGWWYSGCNTPCNILGLGFDYWDTNPAHQIFSLKDVEIKQATLQGFNFDVYLTC